MNDCWSLTGNFIYRHHVEPREKLHLSREESFPIPLKYIDVTRTTHTNLVVKQGKRIDDNWNIDGSRDLTDPWTGFIQLTLLEEKCPEGHMWSGVRLTRKQQTSRPDHSWTELWESMGKHAKLKEKQKWSFRPTKRFRQHVCNISFCCHFRNSKVFRCFTFLKPQHPCLYVTGAFASSSSRGNCFCTRRICME